MSLFFGLWRITDRPQMRREGLVVEVAVRVRVHVHWRGEPLGRRALSPWRLTLPRGQVVPERQDGGAA